MSRLQPLAPFAPVAAIVVLLSACGGGGGDEAPAATAITGQPAAMAVDAGQTATFTVQASGSGLRYQWQRNGTDIPGATGASYTTAALDTSASGSTYRVVVRGDGGTVTSASATLTVNTVLAAGWGDNTDTARALANEAFDALQAAERRSQVPGGVLLMGLPAGVATVVPCTFGGNYTYELPTSINVGTTYGITYNNCQLAQGYTYNGSYQITYNSFNTNGNYSWTATYNLTLVGPNINYTNSGSQTCTYTGGVGSCTYSDGTRTFNSNFTYNAGVVNGTYTWNGPSGAGTVSYNFNNFNATGGTITVTASNGFTATITRTGANTFSVVINGGTARVVTITRP